MSDDLLDKMNEAIATIRSDHDQIIDDWCKAYMAQIYKEKGSINPGDFTLNMQMGVVEDDKIFNRYWFTPKEEMR